MAFSRHFGPLEDSRGGNITKPEDRRLRAEMNDVSKLGRDGAVLERDSRQRLFSPEEQAMFRPVRQRLARTHPAAGRKSR